jgi:N-acyl-D-aspartate/D-glutamate deacylase
LYPQIGCRPFEFYMNWQKLMPTFAHLPTWRQAMFLPAKERVAALATPATRAAMRSELAGATFFNGWPYVVVKEAKRPEHKALEGQSIAAIAAAQGKDPLDTYLDLCVAEECLTDFTYLAMDMEEEPMGRMLKDPNTLLETDAGAHLASLCNADFPTYVLAHWVRETGVLGLEEAVARLTARPADAFGLVDRGRLKPGLVADLVIFDLERVGGGQLQTVHDLPARQPRLIQPARGVQQVIVNGEVVLEEGKHTGALPGRVVRAG